jgi:hypothetical protein
MEIGASAISFLVATWEGHLTPPEAASMADKASKSREETMVSGINLYVGCFVIVETRHLLITFVVFTIEWHGRAHPRLELKLGPGLVLSGQLCQCYNCGKKPLWGSRYFKCFI